MSEENHPDGTLTKPLSWRDSLTRGSVWGAALGAWWSLWVLAAMWACELVWLHEPWLRKSPFRVRFDSVWEGYAERWIWWPTHWWWLVLLLVVAGAVAGVAAAVVVRGLRMDCDGLATAALRWAALKMLRGWWFWAAMCLSIWLVVVGPLGPLGESLPWFGWVVVAVTGLAWSALPLAVLRREILIEEDHHGWWWPAWPGVGPMVTAAAAAVVAIGVSRLFLKLVGGWNGLAWWALAGMLHWGLLVVAASALVWRIGPNELAGLVPAMMMWRRLGPWLLVWLRSIVLGAWLLAPGVVLFLPRSRSLSGLEAAYLAQGASVPAWLGVLFDIGSVLALVGCVWLLTAGWRLVAGGRVIAVAGRPSR